MLKGLAPVGGDKFKIFQVRRTHGTNSLLDHREARRLRQHKRQIAADRREAGGRLQRIPTVSREVYDVTGAGDTVIAAFALAHAAGASFADAARIANHAAGIAVGHVGTAAPSLEELRGAMAG